MTLQEYFNANPKGALALSGGVDSAYLLHCAQAAGAQVQPYFAETQFQPAFERRDATQLCGGLGLPLKVLALDVLADAQVRRNPPERCYHCKRKIFSAIAAAAAQDGYRLLWDGTNASDAVMDRPGMRALQELQVQSPLRLCGLTKAQIRAGAKAAGLPVWDKPAYACLATRVAARYEDHGRESCPNRAGGAGAVYPGLSGFSRPPAGRYSAAAASAGAAAPGAGATQGAPTGAAGRVFGGSIGSGGER